MKIRTAGAVAIAAAASLVLTACGSDDGGGDAGTLILGGILPITGSLAFLGPPMAGSAQMAVDEINAADMGIQIQYEFGDEGDTDTKTYETSIERLRGAGITAMVGAASTGVTKSIIDANIAAGILMVSPSNTGPDLTDWDDNGLFFRTAPSDLLQGEVLGNVISADGHQTLGIIYQNDAYGEGLRAKVNDAFTAGGGTVVAEASFNVGDATFDAQVNQVMAENPDAVAVFSYDQFVTIGPLLFDAGLTGSQLYLVDGNKADYSASSDQPLAINLEGTTGTTAGLALPDDFKSRLAESYGQPVNDLTYAGESYDAVVLMALAALAAKSTVGADIAAKMQEVSGGSGNGTKCTSFVECAQIINDGGVADYDGYSGEVTFDDNGDPTGAGIGVFKYGADNTYSLIDTIIP
jgi:branched-chain amino acid transport system substrate-binding protein